MCNRVDNIDGLAQNREALAQNREACQSSCNINRVKTSVKPKHTLCVVMFNAQSIRSKFEEFRCYMAIHKPDMVCVTETWVSESFNGDRLQDFTILGYNMFSYCREFRQGGGILLYVNNMYCATRVEDTLKRKDVESIWIELKIGVKNKRDLRIGTFYRQEIF